MTKQIFEGLKVLEFCPGAAGPCAGRELAMHGASVIRVESYRNPDTLRTMPPYKDFKAGINRSLYGTAYQTQKYNVSLDANHPKSKDVIKKLILWADVMGESFAPGSIGRLGLDYESVRKIKTDIIYFSSSQMGQRGPLAGWRGYGPHGSAYGGFSHILGLPDREPLPTINAHSDFISYPFLACCIIAALIHRRRTGQGMYIDLSQQEAAAYFLGPAILDYTVNSRVLDRMGNRDRSNAPHGAYRCRGQNCWKGGRYVVISVTSEEEWTSFCQVLGNPEFAKEPKFATALGRKEHEDELDSHIEAWTMQFTAEQVMTMMQEAGVPCGLLETAEDLLSDPQLQHREHFRVLQHREIGGMSVNSPAYRLSKTPCHISKAGPCIGEDNEYILKKVLGYTDDDLADLLAEGALTTEADTYSQ